ncbi:hypothetical protein ES708_35232 [subsurface metagenome]
MEGGFIITLTTNVPCHLWLYWTNKPPWTHKKTALSRGLLIDEYAYWCFVAWHKIEQDEDGDTLVHTFLWLGWAEGETRWFRFHGEIDGQESPSDSPIYVKTYWWEEPPPPEWAYYEPWSYGGVPPPPYAECYYEPWTV